MPKPPGRLLPTESDSLALTEAVWPDQGDQMFGSAEFVMRRVLLS